MLNPVPSTFIRPAPVWSAQVGAAASDSDAFVGGTITLTATTATRLLVVFFQIGNIGGRVATITIGGTTPTNVAQVDGWYIFTMPVSTSGTSLTLSGTQSGTYGRSVWRAYELSGYLNATPAIVTSSPSSTPVSSFTPGTSTNMAAGGLFEEYPAVGSVITSSAGTAPNQITTYLDIGYYMNWTQANTGRNTTYTLTAASRYLFAAWR